MLFLKWLRDEKGYPIYDAWSLTEIFSAQEVETLWEEHNDEMEGDDNG
jgi:hypothetical protein